MSGTVLSAFPILGCLMDICWMKGWVNSSSHPAGITDGKLSILLKLPLQIGQKKKKKKNLPRSKTHEFYTYVLC